MPAKTTAAAVCAAVLCVAVITVSVIGAFRTPVRAADIYIGTENAATAPTLFGVGRYSVVTGESTETGAPVATDAPDEIITDNTEITDEESVSSRYTVTFTFHSRDSISCSAEEEATVAELAERLGITFSDADVLNVDVNAVISEDTIVSTEKVTYATVTETESIPFETKYVDDSSIYKGNSKVSTYGQNGKTVTEYEVKYVNGVEESRTEIKSYVAKKPVTQVIRRGTAVYTPPAVQRPTSSNVVINNEAGTITGSDGQTYHYSGYLDVKAVWYSAGGFCANGMAADENVIAVDPSVIPLGTKVYITGDYADIGVRIAADTGGGVVGNMVDICFNPSNPLAQGFGARPMRVYFID